MAKEKAKGGVPNKHLHARISYLNQAAKYLATCGQKERSEEVKNTVLESKHDPAQTLAARNESAPDHSASQTPPETPYIAQGAKVSANQSRDLVFQQPSFGGLPLQLSGHLAQVARKSQIRLHQSVKHAICKRCSTPLVEGQTCSRSVENLSKGGRKPHADVLVLQCKACGATKRWPVGAQRQKRKTCRTAKVTETTTTAPKQLPDSREDPRESG